MAKPEDLKNEYKLLLDLMDSIPDVIYFKDTAGRLLMVNKAHAKGLGLKPKEVIGKTDFDFFSKKRAEKMARDDMHVIRTGRPIIDKVERATRPDGVDNYVSTTKIPRRNSKGDVIGIIGITRDITQRMQLERLREERADIEEKLRTSEELSRMKSDFVSAVSHELRTPLAIIKEAVMLIFDRLTGPVNTKQEELLMRARNNIGRLNNIIGDLLDVSRIESGKLKLHYSLVNLNDLLREFFVFFKKLAQEEGIDFRQSLPVRQINIFIDAERVGQVISNLISNAIKYTECNGKIKVEVRVMDDKVRIGVIDTGIGIAKENLPKIFDRFVQVSRKQAATKKGVGLGLSIAKELVDRHGGEIWAESKAGVGSKFYFTLPRFYTTKALGRQVRNKITSLLHKGVSLFIINLLIVNFKEFKKRIRVPSGELFSDLQGIIKNALKEIARSSEKKPQMVVRDRWAGEYSIIFPEATEKQAGRLCRLLKDRIEAYFTTRKLKNTFINLGVISYPRKRSLRTTQQLLANLYVKKIYVGAEIRRHRRVSYKASIKTLLPENKTHSSQTIDISGGGVCFVVNRLLKTDSKINISLSLLGSKDTVHVKGRVAWIKKIEGAMSAKKDEKYRVGLEFIGLKGKDKKVLLREIKKASS